MKIERSPVGILENPGLNAALTSIQTALSEQKTLFLVGNCAVEYKGRASSKLEPGERILIIKEDGSVLVHRPTDYSPVNWQPPGCLFQTGISEGKLRIRAVRKKVRESITIVFETIYLLVVLSLVDKGAFYLYASEEDMEKAIVAEPSLIEPGFKVIAFEKPIEPGFVDVYGLDEKGRLVVIEIKRGTAGKTAVLQLEKYLEAMRKDAKREIRGILVAPNLAKGVQALLTSLKIEYKPLSPQQCYNILQKQQILRQKGLETWLNST